MNQENAFCYTYSAKENTEVLEIRRKYLPPSESKMEELKRLENTVQSSGIMESLCAGIGGALVFGLGLCLAIQVIGSGILSMIVGILFSIVGVVGMIAAYPVYRKVFEMTKEKHAPRILELAAEITGGQNSEI